MSSSPFPLFPPNASSVATEMDLLYLFIAAVSAFFVVLVAALVFVFAVKYRRRHPDEVGADIHGSLALELTWTVIPFILAMVSHFAVGAARSIFTGRGVFRSGMDMFLVGLGVAGVGYLVGDWIVKLL